MNQPTPITTREEAAAAFLDLIRQYGLQWTAKVPREAHERLTQINRILTLEEIRALALTDKLLGG